MSKLTFVVSATIVLILAGTPSQVWASPQDTAPEDSTLEHQTNRDSSQDSRTLLPQNMQISPAPRVGAPPPPENPHYYPYRQQLTLRYGRAGDFPKVRIEDNVTGFQYMFPKFLSPRLEAGADLHDDGNGHVHVGARWIANERGYFRPSLKAAADVRVAGRENLATFTYARNYFLRTTATLEEVMWNPYSVRLETELLFGTENTILEITLGLSRGW